jgi:hypothetical protein
MNLETEKGGLSFHLVLLVRIQPLAHIFRTPSER